MSRSRRTVALTTATVRDVLRRPGTLLSFVVVLTLVALLPRVAARALDDGAALFRELTAGTAIIYLSLLSGLTAVGYGAADHPRGPNPELLATPLSSLEYVAGRVGGLLGAAAVLLVPLVVVAAVCLLWSEGTAGVPALTATLWALLGVLLAALFFAALGLALGATCRPALATVLLLAAVVALRLAPPGLSEGLWHWAPDPGRLDLAREIGFDRALSTPSLAAAAGALLAQTCALTALAAWGVGRARPSATGTAC